METVSLALYTSILCRSWEVKQIYFPIQITDIPQKLKIIFRQVSYLNLFNHISLDFELSIVQFYIFPPQSRIIFPTQSGQMSSDWPIEEAGAWYFKEPRVACPEIDCFNPNFFIGILDARKSVQMPSIRQAGTICFSSTESDPCSCGRFHPFGR